MRIALAGNPNSGKTSVYNALTGEGEYVGNWAGVTVDKKEAPLKKSFKEEDVIIVDLPGAYSMSPYTKEESITSDFVKNEKPDVIINIVDAINLSRSLFFTTQLLELGIPVVIALNKSDLTDKKTIELDAQKLTDKLGCRVVETSMVGEGTGLVELIGMAKEVLGSKQAAPYNAGKVDLEDLNAVHRSDVARFEFVKGVTAAVEKRGISSHTGNLQDKVDKIIANKWLGIPIFIVVMWLVFAISQSYVGPFFADLLGAGIDWFYGFVEGLLGESASPVLTALLLDGIIGGVGAVVGFLPLIMVLFFLLALLEDCGYMARVAVVMDRFFKKVGLNGRSIIPMIVGTGCAIPGVMATRTIKDERQRRTTAMLTPFMPCGAKLPVIALFAGAFFADIAAWMNTIMYFSGIILIILGAFAIKKITGTTVTNSFFIIELPEYKVPSVGKAALSMLSRAKAFIIKAGTIILLCNAVVHIMQTFDWSFNVVAENAQDTSILASLASPFAVLLIPVGFGMWQLAAAAITGFIAKENVVGTLAVVYGITNYIDTEALEMMEGAAGGVAETMGITAVAAMAYLMFNLFTPPCFAAIGAMNSEMESPKWLFAGIGLQLGVGYVVAFFVYQIGTLITTGALGNAFIQGLIAVAVILGIIIYKMVNGGKEKAPVAKAVKA